jgi:uncharacterized membrane protein YhaH (DUF805 family)
MGFGEAVRLFFRNYAKFEGRSRRSEFWWPQLFFILVGIAVSIIVGIFAALGDIGAMIGGLIYIVYMLFSLAIIIPSIAVGFRRLHDTERSAWWLLIGFIPLIGAIVLLVFYCLEGTKGPNKYGRDPKGLGDAEVF